MSNIDKMTANEQLFTELPPEEGANVSGGYRGLFSIYASSSTGLKFTNNSGATQTYSLEAFGSWFVADDGRLPVSPNGYSRSTGSNIAPHLPGGALVMRRSNNLYEMVGKSGELTLGDGDFVHFLMNDQHNSYGDNSGWVELLITR